MAEEVTAEVQFDYDRSVVGVEVDVGTFTVSREDILAFAQTLGETNPLFTDGEAARAQGFRDIVAPPTLVSAFRTRPGLDPKVRFGNTGFHAGQHCEFFEPVQAGDTIQAKAKVLDVYAKTGRAGTMVFSVSETAYYNQHGRLVARVENSMVRRFLQRGE